MTKRERSLYAAAYRLARKAFRRQARALASEFEGELDELRDELHAARRQLDTLRALDEQHEADERDGAALH
jgi:hypothetical protein